MEKSPQRISGEYKKIVRPQKTIGKKGSHSVHCLFAFKSVLTDLHAVLLGGCLESA
jgi:hypothetical protein